MTPVRRARTRYRQLATALAWAFIMHPGEERGGVVPPLAECACLRRFGRDIDAASLVLDLAVAVQHGAREAPRHGTAASAAATDLSALEATPSGAGAHLEL